MPHVALGGFLQKPRAFAFHITLAVLALIRIGPAAPQQPLPDSDELGKIPRLLAQYSVQQGDLRLPNLSTTELDSLATGSPLVMLYRDPTAEPGDKVRAMRVVGWQLVKAPRLIVWLSLLMGRDDSSARLQHIVLAKRAAGAYVSYHHIDLPWPAKDRHWLLLCEKNSSLASESHDDIWEHRWSLLPRDDSQLEAAYDSGDVPGLTRKAFDDSLYLIANQGAWVVFDLGAEGTLVAASMDIDLGGRFPVALVQSFAKHQMREFFESLAALRGANYQATPVIEDGRGVPINAEAARREAGNWERPSLLAASETNDSP
jgi:hypothetical protein